MEMTISRHSNSDPTPSQSFARLHSSMQRWVHEQGWTTLHDAQERAIGPILDARFDVIISAATAAGKTEAAFLPICSTLALQREALEATPPLDPWEGHDPWARRPGAAALGIEVLCLSPLKALINDQFDRLELICDQASVTVHRWHGDVSGSAKRRTAKNPSGVLLITPESLEAQFVNRGSEIASLFAGLRYVVIDELHSFLGNPRGAQVQSLLNRIDLAIRRSPPRIGLSATLGDMSFAKSFLRPGRADDVVVIESSSASQEIRLQLRGYRRKSPDIGARRLAETNGFGQPGQIEQTTYGDQLDVADHLFRTLRGRDNLVFANSRGGVETFADLLARQCARENVPNEFWPHHGSLAKEVREVVESQLKDRSRPATAVCTSTLEMGIDIGSVASVAQIGPPPSVASLRQRLGRAGRRGEPAVLRLYVTESEVDGRSAIADELRCRVVQTIAMVRLMLDHWLEPSDRAGLNLSTLVQQVLSTIAQHGGATASELFGALCGAGPFGHADPALFGRLLRAMAAHDLVFQAGDGLLLPADGGERAINHYSFYSAFHTPKEWRLLADGRPLGTMPIATPLVVDRLLIFAGRRWRIKAVDTIGHTVDLVAAAGGVPPAFGSDFAIVGDRIRQEMVEVYRSTDVPEWLDPEAKRLLGEGRASWRRLELDKHVLVASGNDTIILPWVGDRGLSTAALVLSTRGLKVTVEGPTINIAECSPREVLAAVRAVLAAPLPDAVDFGRRVENSEVDKWDWALDPELRAEAVAARDIDIPSAWRVFSSVDACPGPKTGPIVVPGDPPGPKDDLAVSDDQPGAVLGHLLRDGQRLAVIDVETTGLFNRDRIVEVSIVTLDQHGDVAEVFETLVNPGRDLGPTWLHRITPEMVVDAPTFFDVAHHIAARLDGAIVVGHNLTFDQRMLKNEFDRASVRIEWGDGLDTLTATGCKLGVACTDHGVEFDGEAHSARADALATAGLLVSLADAFAGPFVATAAHIPPDTQPVKICTRSGKSRVEASVPYLASLAAGIRVESAVAPYVALLDVAIADLKISAGEWEQLGAEAARLGLTETMLGRAHHEFMTGLIDAAIDDRVVTEEEYDQLTRASALLGVDPSVVALRTDGYRTSNSRLFLSEGLRICFTGSAIDAEGRAVSRSNLETLVVELGCVPTKNVSAKSCDLLLAADPATRSGKADKARKQGIPIASVADFVAAAPLGGSINVSRLDSHGIALVCIECGTSWLSQRSSSRPVCSECREPTS